MKRGVNHTYIEIFAYETPACNSSIKLSFHTAITRPGGGDRIVEMTLSSNQTKTT